MHRRLHWGCGPKTAFGWVNSDIANWPGVDIVADIRTGLPVPESSFDYAASIHALPELTYAEQDQALRELWRVLVPGGVLRLGLPDADRAIRAYRDNDIDYFLIDDDVVRSIAGKMIVQLTWYGRSRCLFTREFMTELLGRNGFVEITGCEYQQTCSPYPGIVELDDRPLESFFIEARRPTR